VSHDNKVNASSTRCKALEFYLAWCGRSCNPSATAGCPRQTDLGRFTTARAIRLPWLLARQILVGLRRRRNLPACTCQDFSTRLRISAFGRFIHIKANPPIGTCHTLTKCGEKGHRNSGIRIGGGAALEDGSVMARLGRVTVLSRKSSKTAFISIV